MEGLVIVDVWGAWCGPCRIIGPIIDELADDYSDQVVISKLTKIPSILFMRNGQEVDREFGAISFPEN